MKTLKNTTIIAGILVAVLSVTAYAEKIEAEKTAERKVMIENMGINKTLELNIIEEYLAEQEISNVDLVEEVKIYNANDELVYEGEAKSEKAKMLKLSADFLMEYNHTTYYRFKK